MYLVRYKENKRHLYNLSQGHLSHKIKKKKNMLYDFLYLIPVRSMVWDESRIHGANLIDQRIQ